MSIAHAESTVILMIFYKKALTANDKARDSVSFGGITKCFENENI